MNHNEANYEYLAQKGFKPTAIKKEIGLSNGYLSVQKKHKADMGEGVIIRITDYFRDLNSLWLLTDEGSMIRAGESNPIHPTPLHSEDSLLYKMYQKKEAENKALIEEIGGLKERVRQMESYHRKYRKNAQK